MKPRNLVALAAAVVLLCSCIPSVNPFYTAKDVVYDPRLLGEWQTKDESDDPRFWKFEEGPDRSYKLTVREKNGKEGQFTAHLFQLKQHQFLDLMPAECNYSTNQADLIAFSMIPGHLLFRVTQVEPTLKMAACDYDWLADFLKENPKALEHIKDDSQKPWVLTADTRDLQKFILKHLKEDELFDRPGELVRK